MGKTETAATSGANAKPSSSGGSSSRVGAIPSNGKSLGERKTKREANTERAPATAPGSSLISDGPATRVGAIPSTGKSLGERKTKREARDGASSHVATIASEDNGEEKSTRGRNGSSAPATSAPDDSVPAAFSNMHSTNGLKVGAVHRRLGEPKAKREERAARRAQDAATVADSVPNTATPAPPKRHYGAGLEDLEDGSGRSQSAINPRSHAEMQTEERIRSGTVNTTNYSTEAGIDKHDDLLAVAKPVDDLDTVELPSAVSFDHEKEAQIAEERRRKGNFIALSYFGCGLILLIGVILLVVFITGGDDSGNIMVLESNATLSPSMSPSAAPSWQGSYLLNLLPEDTQEKIFEGDSPQREALGWIIDDSEWMDYSDARLLQRFALATLYYATGGDAWYTSSMIGEAAWLDPKIHECKWVYANITNIFDDFDGNMYYNMSDNPCAQHTAENSEVEEWLYEYLWLPESNLVGTIPPELYLLSSLKVLNFQANDLAGTISSQIGLLTNLEALSLSYNGMTGTIPDGIVHCSNLTALLLQENSFDGVLPSTIFQLTKTQHLWLESTGLNGNLPPDIGLLTDIQTFFIQENALSGTIPTEIGMLERLTEMNIKGNNFTSVLPSELGKLTNLEYLSQASNWFSGTLPSELGRLTNLKLLNSRSNKLTGTLPTELGQLTSLEVVLSLRDNSFTGTLPSELGLLGILGQMLLSGNQISGSIPSEFGQLEYLYLMYLEYNLLDGTIPSELGLIPFLEELALSFNIVSGSIPVEISQQPYLTYFMVDNNRLTGTVPSFNSVTSGVFGETHHLPYRTINVTGNAFSGVVPSEMCILDETYFQFDCSDTLCGCDCTCELAGNISSVVNASDLL